MTSFNNHSYRSLMAFKKIPDLRHFQVGFNYQIRRLNSSFMLSECFLSLLHVVMMNSEGKKYTSFHTETLGHYEYTMWVPVEHFM